MRRIGWDILYAVIRDAHGIHYFPVRRINYQSPRLKDFSPACQRRASFRNHCRYPKKRADSGGIRPDSDGCRHNRHGHRLPDSARYPQSYYAYRRLCRCTQSHRSDHPWFVLFVASKKAILDPIIELVSADRLRRATFPPMSTSKRRGNPDARRQFHKMAEDCRDDGFKEY